MREHTSIRRGSISPPVMPFAGCVVGVDDVSSVRLCNASIGWAQQRRQQISCHVRLPPGGCRKVNLAIHVCLLNVGQHHGNPCMMARHICRAVPVTINCLRWQFVVHIVIVVQRQTHLLQIVFALSTTGSFASLLNGRQQQGDQNRNDGDYHQQFNERKRSDATVGQRRFPHKYSPVCSKMTQKTTKTWLG